MITNENIAKLSAKITQDIWDDLSDRKGILDDIDNETLMEIKESINDFIKYRITNFANTGMIE